MPTYHYGCSACASEFDAVKSISDRKQPESEPCPKCERTNMVSILICAPRIVAGVGDMQAKISNNFKDRLKEIKKMAGRHSTIETTN